MIVEHGDVSFVEVSFSLFDGRGLYRFIAMFPQYRGAQDEVVNAIVEQKHTDGNSLGCCFLFVHGREGLSRAIHSSYLPQQSWMRALRYESIRWLCLHEQGSFWRTGAGFSPAPASG